MATLIEEPAHIRRLQARAKQPESVAGGVFKGLALFFIVLPIGLFALFVIMMLLAAWIGG